MAISLRSSSNPIFADGFRLDQPGTKEFIEEVRRYWTTAMRNGELPSPSKVERWIVWLAKQEGLFRHHSLVLQSTSCEGFFTMELLVYTIQVKPVSRQFDPENPPCSLTFTRIGSITSTAQTFFENALNCLENFGDYHEITNNCQDYCKKLAAEYGLDTGWTDVPKVTAAAGAAVSVLGLAAAGLAWWYSRSDDKNEEDDSSDNDS